MGINFAVFLLLCLLVGIYTLITNGLQQSKKSLYLLFPFLFFVVMSFIRREPLTTFLTHSFAIFTLALMATTYLGGRWVEYNLLEYCNKFFQLFLSMTFRPIDVFLSSTKEQADRGENENQVPDEVKRKSPVWPVVRGLLIAIPIVVIFASLLSAADLVFSSKLNALIAGFDTRRISEYIGRLFLVPIYAYVIAGVILHCARYSKNEKLLGDDEAVLIPFLGFTETVIVLTSVAILFLLFAVVQFQYFFGGESNIGIEGYTYSEYARRGFNELLTVALFSLFMILGLSTIAKRENVMQKRIFSGLSIVIVLQVIVILVSSYNRITLANLWHGYSRLRLYPQIFLVWLGILFVAVVILEIIRRERYFAFASVIAVLGFGMTLSLFNVDALIVRHNVLRAAQGSHFNVTHLAILSTDAVPALAQAFLDNSLSTEVHEGIGAALLCHQIKLERKLPKSWQSFTLSYWQANRAIQEVNHQWIDYRMLGKKYAEKVRTPGNFVYLCNE